MGISGGADTQTVKYLKDTFKKEKKKRWDQDLCSKTTWRCLEKIFFPAPANFSKPAIRT